MWILWSFLAVIAALVLVTGFVVLTVKLSGKDSPWPGLITIVLLVVLTLGINLTVLSGVGEEEIQTLTAKLDNGMTAQMAARIKGDEIKSYGPIEIIDNDGILRDCYEVDLPQKDDTYREPYIGLFEKMTAGKKVLPRWSMQKDLVMDMSQKIIFIKGDGENTLSGYTTFPAKTMFYGPLLYMGLPLLVIYGFKRRQVGKRKRTEELRRMEIENL